MIHNGSFDIKQRVLDYRGSKVEIFFTSSLIKDEMIAYLVKGIIENQGTTFEDCINNGDVKIENDVKALQYAILSGCTVVSYQNNSYILDTRKYPGRSVQEPETEKSVRGSKDGFTESLLTCVGLIRRRIKSVDLVMEVKTIGTHNGLDICLCYMANNINESLLDSIRERLDNIAVDDLIMTDRALEEIILQQGYNPFPLVRYTERPDVVATHLLHGFPAIICDTSSSVMLLPTTIFEILEHVEEHRQTPLIGTFIRLLRYFAVLLSVYLVPLWLLSVVDSVDITTLIYQVLSVEISIELLRLATIHTPTSISNAMGVIAAILLGQFAIDLGLFSEEVLLLCAIGNVSGFATPNYELSLTNKYVRILLILGVLFFQKVGFVIVNLMLGCYLLTLKPFGYSYLSPLIPLDLKSLFNHLIRKPKHK